MRLQLKELFDIEGERKALDFEIPVSELEDRLDYEPDAPIAAKGEVVNHAGIVTLNVDVGLTLRHVCDRCLKEFIREYRYSFDHTLVRTLYNGDDDERYVVCGDNSLDLDELLISDILLELPTKILCKEDCKGLCPQCGQDLNEGSCVHYDG